MYKKEINLLSLFDGIGGARLSLSEAITKCGLSEEVKIYSHYSSEIDKNALRVLNHHYKNERISNYFDLGDIRKIHADDIIDDINLVVISSPCLQLSSISPQRNEQLNGKDSNLFFESIRILKELKIKQPNHKLWVICENVASMKNSSLQQMIDSLEDALGEKFFCIKIDSAIHAPAHRRRVYITNFNVPQPEPVESNLQDILENGFSDKDRTPDKSNVLLSTDITLYNGLTNRFLKRNIGTAVFANEEFAKLSKEDKILQYPKILKESGYEGKGGFNELDFPNGCYRNLTIKERLRCHGIHDDYLDVEGISRSAKQRLIGEGFCIPTLAHVMSYFLKEFIK